MVCQNLFDSQYKIAEKWEDEPYQVISQMDDTPVYRVKAVNSLKASVRVLHQNMLHLAHSVCEDDCQPLHREVPTALSKVNALMEAYFER